MYKDLIFNDLEKDVIKILPLLEQTVQSTGCYAPLY